MINSLTYDADFLFDSPTFHKEALKFFSAVGHTSAITPLIVAEDILRCIYAELNFNAYFDKSERRAFSCMESLSHLFTLVSNMFFQQCCPQIRYYAISLNTARGDRTVVADTIINAFAKNTSDYIVILFRHEKMCALSFTKKTNGFITFFSDWFDDASVVDITNRIDIVNLSLQNSSEFFLDFVYMAARRYYIEPVSREYALSEWYYMNPLTDGADDRLSCSEHVTKILNAHILKYGDDYIDIPVNMDCQTGDFESDDFDFDLLELELDEMIASSVFEIDDEDYEGDDKAFYEIEHIDATSIPFEIINDPVKLLEWLEQIERQKEKKAEDEG